MSLQRTPVYPAHLALKARMVEFNGWEMPVQYQGIIAEHRAVREACGLFDVSHMGRVAIAGPGSAAFVAHLLTNDLSTLAPGRARYTLLCNQEGGILDDLVVFRRGEEDYLAVPNSGSYPKVLAWLRCWAEGAPEVNVAPLQARTAMLAVQGPKAQEVLAPLTDIDLAALGRFRHAQSAVAGVDAAISRTGYTGEDGFELIVGAEQGPVLWEALLEAGALPCGLGARDTLRLEAGLRLYGADMDASVTPLEAGLERFVRLEKEFVGAEALRRAREEGVRRRLAGFKVDGRGIPRAHQAVLVGDERVGEVTSGTFSPSLGVGIGLAYLPPNLGEGAAITIDVRGRGVHARVVPLPFYRGR